MQTTTGEVKLTEMEMQAWHLFEANLDEGLSIPRAAKNVRTIFEALGERLDPKFWAWLAH